MAANFAESIEWVCHQLKQPNISNEAVEKRDYDTLTFIFHNIDLPELFGVGEKEKLFRVATRLLDDVTVNKLKLNAKFLEAVKSWHGNYCTKFA